MKLSLPARLGLRTIALLYLAVLVVVPLIIILWRSFGHGIGAFFDSITTPAAVSSIDLTLLIIVIVLPLNVIFGVVTALALVRGRFPGRNLIQGIVDLPFAVSPVVVGVALIMLWGINGGWFGAVGRHVAIIFGIPGMVLATIFVTLPFVVREVEPVLYEIGDDQEQAAATLGASAWQTFWRITLPSIRWGLTYGIVLTVARALGEFGAVTIVSTNLPGVSQTLTLLVDYRYDQDTENPFGAYAAATLLMALGLITLLVMTVLDRKRDRGSARDSAVAEDTEGTAVAAVAGVANTAALTTESTIGAEK